MKKRIYTIDLNHSVKAYFRYLKEATSRHGVHSPFVYKLMEEVLTSHKRFYSFEALEMVRRAMKIDVREVSVTDFGAGSKKNNATIRKVKSIAASATKRTKYAELLFKLADYIEATTILEMGTSLGLSTAYLGKARKTARIYTLEGCPQTAAIAREYLNQLAITNVEVVVGHFDDKLAEVMAKEPSFDLIFIDGNHREEPTKSYFEQLLPKITQNSIVVLDDIHWSEGMERAWNVIRIHPNVTVSIDIFEMGILFFDTSLQKQHFVLKV
jgi:predicted O-methyltransferase YrrM